MKKDSNHKSIKMFKAGQPVVLIGETTHEREIFIFNTPENFVETLSHLVYPYFLFVVID